MPIVKCDIETCSHNNEWECTAEVIDLTPGTCGTDDTDYKSLKGE